MKAVRTILTAILVPLLVVSTALTLFSGVMRFAVLNPEYYKKHLADEDYCAEMQEHLNDDLGYIAILYGLDEQEVSELVTDEDIRAYTAEYIDAVFARSDPSETFTPAEYPYNAFLNYVLSNTNVSFEAAEDFAYDCAEAVQNDLWAVNQEMILNSVTFLQSSSIVTELTALFTLLLLLTLGLSVIVFCVYIGRIRSGLVALFGSYFCGGSIIFAPLLVFILKGYTERLNIAVSPYRTQLVGILQTILKGGAVVTGLVVAVSLIVIAICIFTKKKR
ncbi:MAG: hypothetical protein Q4C01_02685 [Clostridia bacterium]|nr:hypothetical protein [Clostridia bacterium]